MYLNKSHLSDKEKLFWFHSLDQVGLYFFTEKIGLQKINQNIFQEINNNNIILMFVISCLFSFLKKLGYFFLCSFKHSMWVRGVVVKTNGYSAEGPEFDPPSVLKISVHQKGDFHPITHISGTQTGV